MARDRLLEEADARQTRLTEVVQERRAAEERLEEEKATFGEHVAGLQRQLQLARNEVDGLKAASQKWQQEWNELLSELSRLEGDVKERETEFKTERQSLQTELQDARAKIGELEKARDERDRLKAEVAEQYARSERLQQDTSDRSQSLLTEIRQLREELAARAAEGETLKVRWAAERDDLVRARDAEAAHRAQTEKESRESQARLSEEKGKLEALMAILQERLQAARDELTQLKGASEGWRNEQAQMTALRTQLASMHEAEGTWESERKALVEERTALVETRARLSDEQQANEDQWMAERDELAARVAELTARLERAEAVASASQGDDADPTKNVTDEPAAPEESRPAA